MKTEFSAQDLRGRLPAAECEVKMTLISYDERWDRLLQPKDPSQQPFSLREALIRSGNRDFDVDRLLHSEYGQRTIDGMEPFFLSEDPMDPYVLAYWEKKGLRKERLLGGPQPWNYWTIFTPLSAYLPENAGRKYPLVFGLHGGGAGEFDGEPVFLAESTGYARKAAEEEFILAMPEDHDTPPIMAFYHYLVENYPVDRSRVYLTGYSAGSDRSVRAALRHPEVFAGMLIGAGVPFNLEKDETEIENAVKYKMPFIAVGCLSDKGNHTPFYSSNPIDNPVPDFIARLLSAEGKMEWINHFFRINHIPFYSAEENREYVLSRGTAAERRIGMRAQRSKTWEWAGMQHFCLDYTDREGIDSVRYVFIEGLPHFEPVNMLDLAWPFLKRFSRDPESGSLLCSQAEYKG